MAGKLEYFKKGREALEKEGYVPELEISGRRIIEYKDEINEKGLELLICLAHPFILKKEEIDLFPKGCINLHSGIPNYCGRNPVNWMIIDGVKNMPVAVHFMSEEIDGGDIILEDYVIAERNDNYKTLVEKISEKGSGLLLAAIKQIEAGIVYRKKQIFPRRYPKRRTPADSRIDWNKTSYEMHNFISALVEPMPNAFSYTKEGELVNFEISDRGKEVGEVIAETKDDRYVVTTNDGVILVKGDKKLKIGEKFDTLK